MESLILIAAQEHVSAIGPAAALGSLRNGCPREARAHLADLLSRPPTAAERRALCQAIRSTARAKGLALLEEAEGYEEGGGYLGIDVDALERALFTDDHAEPVAECRGCRDAGYLLVRDDEGMLEREDCECVLVARPVAA